MLTAKKLFAEGDTWTDRIARLMLPVLLNQARMGETITYGGMREALLQRHQEPPKHAANYGRPAGKVGNVLLKLSDEWRELIPPFNAIVVNQGTRLPGSGADYYLRKFVKRKRAGRLSKDERRALAENTIEAVFDYPKLDQVARYFGLPLSDAAPPEPENTPIEPPPHRSYGTGGESRAHKNLKTWIAKNPNLFKKFGKFGAGEVERRLDSGDEIDVLFTSDRAWLGIEAKTADAPESELWRGIFQCIKYRATLRAMRKVGAEIPAVRVLLVLESNPGKRIKAVARRLEVDWMKLADLR